MQLTPSPVYPVRQVHWNEPGTSTHEANLEQLWLPSMHSLISVEVNHIIVVYYFINLSIDLNYFFNLFISCKVKLNYLPEQLKPSPVYPVGQLHWNEPGTSTHDKFAEQLWLPSKHSFISATGDQNVLRNGQGPCRLMMLRTGLVV